MPSFLQPIDLNKLELRNAVVQNLASAPGTPVEGQIYYDTVTDGLYLRLASSWLAMASNIGVVGNITGIVKSSGSTLSAASAGTDFLMPNGSGASLTNLTGSSISSGTVSATYLPVLNAISAPTGSLSLNSQKITNLLDGTASTDAATYGQVSSLLQGLNPKPGATVATAAVLPACTYANGSSGVGATLTGDANGALTVDAYAVIASDIVLVKNQVTGLQNGLYTVTQPGTGGTPFILTRHTSMDTTTEFARSSIVVEDAGATVLNTLWVCTNSSSPTVGTTAITFSQLASAAAMTQGTGISIAGQTISIATAYQGNGIGTVNGITKGNGSGTITAAAMADIRSAGGVGKYSATLGDGVATSYAITQATHLLASTDQIVVQLANASTGAIVQTDISVNPANGTVTITFATAPASNAYRVILLG